MSRYNPFNPNSVVAPSLFAGRSHQVLEILQKLEHVRRGMSSSFILHGERGIGKTALAKLIKFTATSKNPKLHNLNFVTSYYSVEKGQDLKSVIQSSLNALTDQLEQGTLERLAKRVGSIFKGGKFSFGSFSVELSEQEKIEAQQLLLKDQVVSVLTNILKSFADKSDEAPINDGILFIIDEVHNLKDIAGAAQVLRSIATTLDVNGNGNVSFMVIGYSEAIKDFFEGDPSAKRHFDSIRLDIMPLEEAKDILIKGFKEADVSFNEEELIKNVHHTGGCPHSIQVLGHNVLLIDQDDKITEDDWKEASLKTAYELQSKDFSNLYTFDGKSTTREMIMDVLAIGAIPMPKHKVKELCGNKNIYQSSILGELKRIGAVRENNETSELSLQSSLFRSAILMHVFQKKRNESHVISTIKYVTLLTKNT